MNCAQSRQSVSYQQATKMLIRYGMIFPNDDMYKLILQPFDIFARVFELVYCLDACKASQESYKQALTIFGSHSSALRSLYNEKWRVMFWYGKRIRIVNLKTL